MDEWNENQYDDDGDEFFLQNINPSDAPRWKRVAEALNVQIDICNDAYDMNGRHLPGMLSLHINETSPRNVGFLADDNWRKTLFDKAITLRDEVKHE